MGDGHHGYGNEDSGRRISRPERTRGQKRPAGFETCRHDTARTRTTTRAAGAAAAASRTVAEAAAAAANADPNPDPDFEAGNRNKTYTDQTVENSPATEPEVNPSDANQVYWPGLSPEN
jgi:hypothetical protein